MLRFADFLAKAHSAFDKQDEWRTKYGPDADFVVPLLSESHVFVLGEDADFNEATKEIDDDLRDEMKDGVPMPFNDISVCSLVRKPMEPATEQLLHQTVKDLYPGQVQMSGDLVALSGGPVWVLDRLILIDKEHPAAAEIRRAPGPVSMDGIKQWFLMARFHGVEGNFDVKPMVWSFGYRGISKETGQVGLVTLAVAKPLSNEMGESCRYVAAISHPAQYVVKVTPELTPKEARRVQAGKTFPTQKAPHFLVVDHEVIVRMRKDPTDTHASPIPHERRGHWARLAERCRHAKLLGKDKVWKKPTFVGEKTWKGEKNLYEVLIDFGKKGEIGGRQEA